MLLQIHNALPTFFIRLLQIHVIEHFRKLPYRYYAKHTLPSLTIIRSEDVVHWAHSSVPQNSLSSPLWQQSDGCSTSRH